MFCMLPSSLLLLKIIYLKTNYILGSDCGITASPLDCYTGGLGSYPTARYLGYS